MRSKTPVRTEALQLTNSKRYTPAQGEHIIMVSMQMKEIRAKTYKSKKKIQYFKTNLA